MIIVYVAHPIGGDVQRNMLLVEERCSEIYRYRPEVIPLAPYLMALKFLDDSNPSDRLRGTLMNREFFTRKVVDELWLFGPCISNGMWEEVCWAREAGIPVVPTSTALLAKLARKEIRVGDIVHIDCSGPGGAAVGRLLSFLPDDGGIVFRNKHYRKRKLLYHTIPWCDISYIVPYRAPVLSPKRLEPAS